MPSSRIRWIVARSYTARLGSRLTVARSPGGKSLMAKPSAECRQAPDEHVAPAARRQTALIVLADGTLTQAPSEMESLLWAHGRAASRLLPARGATWGWHRP